MLLELFTSLPNVVWLCLALAAEVLLAGLASYPISAHVFGSLFSNWLTRIILDLVINLPLHHLHDRPATTGNKILVLAQQLGLRGFVHLFKESVSKYGSNLHLRYSLYAFWALKVGLTTERFLDNYLKALFVYHMHALCEYGVLLLHLFVWADGEFA